MESGLGIGRGQLVVAIMGSCGAPRLQRRWIVTQKAAGSGNQYWRYIRQVVLAVMYVMASVACLRKTPGNGRQVVKPLRFLFS